ncbi:hypothetical protein MBLNU13_g04525t1 [Cladosporium sp. NU13]
MYKLSWQQWIKDESLIRLLNAGDIHNAEIAATTRRSASMRAEPWCLPTAAPDPIFLAKDLDHWKIMRSTDPRAQVETHSMLSTCAILAGLSSEITHCKVAPFARSGDDDLIQKVTDSLIDWIERLLHSGPMELSTRAMVLMLWHACFHLLLSNVDVVERLPNFDHKNDNSRATIERLTHWKDPAAAQMPEHWRRAQYTRRQSFLARRPHIVSVRILCARASVFPRQRLRHLIVFGAGRSQKAERARRE